MAVCAHKLCQEFGWFSGGAGIVIGAVPVGSEPGARDKFGLGNEQLFDAQIMSGQIAVQVERTALSTAIKGLKNVNLALYGGRMPSSLPPLSKTMCSGYLRQQPDNPPPPPMQ